jgi:large subunit ribosomal protein L9
MKVLLRKNVEKLGNIGDLVEVKPGYARNYLVPHGLAVHPTEANIKAVEAERQRRLEELARQRADLEARAESLQGKEITISSRANVEGHLYGSVGPAQIVAALAEEGIFIEQENVILDSLIRQLDKYDVTVRFSEDVSATIHVWIVPVHEGEAEAAEPPAPDEIAPEETPEDQPGRSPQETPEQSENDQ